MKYLPLLLVGIGVLLSVQGTWIYGKALMAQVLLRSAWAQTQEGEPRARPWPWADTWPVLRLLSPHHGVDLIVLEGANGSSLAFGPGRVQNGARPGESGNLALAGHRDTHFAFLEHVAVGDPFWLELPDGSFRRYEVSSTRVVDRSNVSSLDNSGDGLTLVTCYPFHAPLAGGPLRYVVQAHPS